MSLQKRRKLFATGFLAAILAAVLIISLRHHGDPPGGHASLAMTLAGHRYTVRAPAFGPDRTTLHSVACYPGALHTGVEMAVWDAGTGNLVTRRREHLRASRSPTFAPSLPGESMKLWKRLVNG
jgi:hypothetical protein